MAPLLQSVLALGPLGSPPAILLGLIVLLLVVFVGRIVLALAWRLVIIALIAVTILWILGLVGF